MQTNYKIRKRNGSLADFDLNKIQTAISKAAVEVNVLSQEQVQDLSKQVFELIQSRFIQTEKALDVESVQDTVEEVLIKEEQVKMAKAYILYRAEHKKLREEKKEAVQEAVEKRIFKITNEKGNEELFDLDLLTKNISTLAKDLERVDAKLVVDETVKLIYSKITISELRQAIVSASKSLISRHYNYSYLTARLLWDDLYKAVLKGSSYQEKFTDYITEGIKYELLSSDLERFDLGKLANSLKPERDRLFQYLGAQTIYDRYLLKTPQTPQQIFELPQWMWMRVSMGLSLREDNPTERAIEFYEVLSQMLLISSTPTLFNSGTTHSQMSSCYLNSIDDSLKGIFKCYSDVAMLSKWAGGVGTDWTSVRALGAQIKGTNGSSQGIIPFIKIFNDIAVAVNQGGKRKGALAAYLEVWHSDIEDFLELKKNSGDERRRSHDIHPACWIPDLFMKRVRKNKPWTLFSPDEVPELHELYGKAFEEKYEYYEKQNLKTAKQIDAATLWRKMLTMLYETGHPWITFKDPCNLRSPQDHVGVVHNSNLCTEITLNNSKDETAVCNLASINLAKMVKDGELDQELIKKTLQVGMRMLDNVIDVNFYPTPEARNANLKHRPVGLGIMGYQDALYKMNIPFASERNVEFADESTELISYHAISASSDLAKERGSYESYPGSKWDRGLLPIDTLELLEKERGIPVDVPRTSKLDWDSLRNKIKKQGMRNSNTMAIAPTATISNIAGSIPCVEPIFRNLYMKENLSGNFLVINTYLVDDLEKLGLWDEDTFRKLQSHDGSVADIDGIPSELKEKYREVFEVEPQWIVKAAARRAKWIDQSASTNIFLRTTSGKVLSEIYMKAWEMGLKTTYYLRTLAASQITKTTDDGHAQSEKNEVKVCLIDNPDCEACQ